MRTGEDDFFVLEDNARTPTGVSYMLENRETILQIFPELFSQIKVQPVSYYPKNLRRSLAACAPAHSEGKPTVAVLTPEFTTLPISNIRFLRTKWALNWSEAIICGSWTVISRCVQPKATR